MCNDQWQGKNITWFNLAKTAKQKFDLTTTLLLNTTLLFRNMLQLTFLVEKTAVEIWPFHTNQVSWSR